MDDDSDSRALDQVVQRAIGGDTGAVDWIALNGEATDDPTVVVMAALFGSPDSRLVRAAGVATTRRDRQMVAIARAHLEGKVDLVDALARDHLADFPDSYVVSWIASGAALPTITTRSP